VRSAAPLGVSSRQVIRLAPSPTCSLLLLLPYGIKAARPGRAATPRACRRTRTPPHGRHWPPAPSAAATTTLQSASVAHQRCPECSPYIGLL
jgi:hypothetical protein